MGLKRSGVIAVLIIFFVFVSPVSALVIPNFPSCVNPQGRIVASHPIGIHGVVGDGATYKGADTVYSVSSSQYLQCLCESNGHGIQTNWLNIAGNSESEIASLLASGWTFIPDGSAWGLTSDPYVARNISYSCLAQGGGTSSSSSSSSNSGGTGGGEVDGTSRGIIVQVLGLASTGSLKRMYDIWLYGLVTLTFGVWLAWLKQTISGKKS